MFSTPNTRVTYFGLWAEEAADRQGQCAALAWLAEVIARCAEEDVRGSELDAALVYLKALATRPALLDRLCRALDIPEPLSRHQAALAALEGVRRHLIG